VSTKKKTRGIICIAVDPPVKQELERIAETKGFTLSLLVRFVLKDYLKAAVEVKSHE
jgi:hypothetical protein